MQMLTKTGKSAHNSPFYLSACRREGGMKSAKAEEQGDVPEVKSGHDT